MGFTPLEGLMMGTRSGDLDPAVHEYLMIQTGWDIKKVTNYLNKESGLLGVSGVSSDMRDLLEAAKNNEDAQLAVDMLSYRVKKYIGSYIAVMNGVDAIVFTAGVGEFSEQVRESARFRFILSQPTKNLLLQETQKKLYQKFNFTS
jgi:acetate kinase